MHLSIHPKFSILGLNLFGLWPWLWGFQSFFSFTGEKLLVQEGQVLI